MSQIGRLAILSPGQGTAILPDWADASGMKDVCNNIQLALPDGPDVQKLLMTPAEQRLVSALNAHILLSAVVGCASNQLRPHLNQS